MVTNEIIFKGYRDYFEKSYKGEWKNSKWLVKKSHNGLIENVMKENIKMFKSIDLEYMIIAPTGEYENGFMDRKYWILEFNSTKY